ncbi:glycosyltransferase [Arthrobacter psychrochitiniphilus]|uniref:D-inositol 3-phosphate glycosyltransferase n=1 Tax=Arthrobacter psychrochitiniphilus TaxID=291045 RepID=A0A2V3DRX1_9MICC|nr:glycosyltransferase [Arthrobacter psychrochitiniphilus]NYG18327.1 glycosyltransferase involved in cell wall biosynthesis [Arthrobacter psychrochitiniphilus]PXA64894.1 glycosyl transferase family 1 [Arthrobacter psychrochitiniphilus]
MTGDFDFRFFTMAAEIRDSGISVPIEDFVPFRDKPFASRERFLPLVMPAMAHSIKRFDPAVIHQHFATWAWPAIRAAKAENIPLVTTLHGSDVVMAGRQATTAMAKWHHHNINLAQKYSSKILAVSEYLANQAIGNGFPSKKITVHYQGIDTDVFRPLDQLREGPNHRSSRPTVLFVGALNDQKGILHLARASVELFGLCEHELVVVGRGVHQEELRQMSQTHPHIRMLGQLSRDEVLAQLQSATLLVAPSRFHNGAREAAGLVLLEAQASGTPVVAYRSGGTPEMVGPNSGRLVTEDDVGGLGNAIRSVLELDSASYAAMKHAAREYVLSQRSLKQSVEELTEHYLEIGKS